jgi:type III restriction enzyme
VPPVVIENPILNSPFTEPARHFRFDEDGITSEVAEGRRRSTYFIPIPKPRVRGGDQLRLPGDWVGERMTDQGRMPQPHGVGSCRPHCRLEHP